MSALASALPRRLGDSLRFHRPDRVDVVAAVVDCEDAERPARASEEPVALVRLKVECHLRPALSREQSLTDRERNTDPGAATVPAFGGGSEQRRRGRRPAEPAGRSTLGRRLHHIRPVVDLHADDRNLVLNHALVQRAQDITQGSGADVDMNVPKPPPSRRASQRARKHSCNALGVLLPLKMDNHWLRPIAHSLSAGIAELSTAKRSSPPTSCAANKSGATSLVLSAGGPQSASGSEAALGLPRSPSALRKIGSERQGCALIAVAPLSPSEALLHEGSRLRRSGPRLTCPYRHIGRQARTCRRRRGP